MSKTPPVDADRYEPIGWRSAALTLLTSALWGGTPVAIAVSVTSLGPIAVSGIRFAMAAVFMVAWARAEGTSLRLKDKQWLPCAIGGVVLFFQISCFTAGIKFANASHGTVLINSFIVWVILFEFVILRKLAFDRSKIAGLVLASTGTAFVVLPGMLRKAQPLTPDMLFGDLLLLLSAMILGGKILFTKFAIRRVEPTKFIFWHDVVGVALFALASWAFEKNSFQDITINAVIGLTYQGIMVAGLCFAIQAHLLKRHSASQLSVFSFSTPIFGLLFAGLFLQEPLTPSIAVSGACVAAGIMLVNRPVS